MGRRHRPLTVLSSWHVAVGCRLEDPGSHLQALGTISASPPSQGRDPGSPLGTLQGGTRPKKEWGGERLTLQKGQPPGHPHGQLATLAHVTVPDSVS